MSSSKDYGGYTNEEMAEAYKAILFQQILRERAYRYAQLPKPTSFRLFYLDPAPPTSPQVHGELKICDLDNPPEYECLSYVWGKGGKDSMIGVGQSILENTASLRYALMHLRLPDRVRVLWIDQLCIDQTNLDERSQQVQQMGRIYQTAQLDLLWLGEESRDSHYALKWVQETIDASRSAALRTQGAVPKLIGADKMSKQMWEFIRDTFLQRPIWRRMWIVQEILLSKKIQIMCGRDTLSWSYLEFMMETDLFQARNMAGGSFNMLLSHAFNTVLFLVRWRAQIQRGSRHPLRELLYTFQSWNATDERDKVFGLLGLAEDIGIVPDYKKSTSDVFIEAATAVIKNSQTLNFICNDQVDKVKEGAAPLPSWVFRVGAKFAPLDSVVGEPIFNAGDTTPPKTPRFSIEGNVLTAPGCHLDYIDTLSDTADNMAWSSPEWHVQLYSSIPQAAIPEDGSGFSAEKWDAIWRALVHDRNTSMVRLTTQEILQYRGEFLDWYHTIASTGSPPSIEPKPDFIRALESIQVTKRRFAITKEKKLLVSVHDAARIGDEVCVLESASVPLVVRRIERKEKGGVEEYLKVGTAFGHGLMYGEAMKHKERSHPRVYRLI